MKELFEQIWNMPAWAVVAVMAVPFALGVAWFIRISRERGRAYADKKAGFDKMKARVESRLKAKP